MPFARPTLSALRAQVAADVAAALPGSDPLLRFSNFGILCNALAGLAHLHYGYLDWTALQANPFTATGEYLEAWAALKGVTRTPATAATGIVQFVGVDGTVVPLGVQLVRSDGRKYSATASVSVVGGLASVPVIADADPAGLDGSSWNADPGTTISLGVTIAGLRSSGVVVGSLTGGADLELDDSLRARMLLAFQQPAHGGSSADYLRWAREIPGVTRAWCIPNGDGPGTVSVYVMLDVAQSAHGGFPQGTDGAAAGELRALAATGDQFAVANYIFPLQPVTALVRARAPQPNPVAFVIAGISGASAATKDAATAAIAQVLLDYGNVGAVITSVPLSYIQSAVAAVPGTAGFLITFPPSNIYSPPGALPVLDRVTWA